jgi:hypothetical protein
MEMNSTFENEYIVITSDFETGNGKNIQQIKPNRFRSEVVGDAPGYNYYFGIRVCEKSSERRSIRLEIVPDPDYARTNVPDFYSNLNTKIWYTKDGFEEGEYQFYQLPEFNFEGEGEVKIFRDRYLIHFTTVPGKTVWLTNMNPLPYSRMTWMLNEEARNHPEFIRLGMVGKSVQGREVNLVEISEGAGEKPVILVIAGEHPTEFPGQWSVWGIIRWLTSSIPEAIQLRRKYRFLAVPQRNPDGNVAGRPKLSSEKIDLNGPPWVGVDEGKEPAGHENQELWNMIKKQPPAGLLNFHGYCGPRGNGDWPCEGGYVPYLEDFSTLAARLRQEVFNDLLIWETEAISQHKQLITVNRGEFLYTPLARLFGTIGCCYEPVDSQGPSVNMKTGVQVLKTLVKALTAVG